MSTINLTGDLLDIRGNVGSDIKVSLSVIDTTGAAVSMAGATMSMRVLSPSGLSTVATFTAGPMYGSPPSKVTFRLPASETTRLEAGGFNVALDVNWQGSQTQWVHGSLKLFKAGQGVDIPTSQSQTITVGGGEVRLQVFATSAGDAAQESAASAASAASSALAAAARAEAAAPAAVAEWAPIIRQPDNTAHNVYSARRRSFAGMTIWTCTVAFTHGGYVGHPIRVLLPAPMPNQYDVGGTWWLVAPGNTIYAGGIMYDTTTSVRLVRDGYGNAMDYTLQVGDVLSCQIITV